MFRSELSWAAFLGLAAYDTGSQAYSLGDKIIYSNFYSGIWIYFEHWSISLVLCCVAAVFGVLELGAEFRESGWNLSDLITIEIVDYDEDDLD